MHALLGRRSIGGEQLAQEEEGGEAEEEDENKDKAKDALNPKS